MIKQQDEEYVPIDTLKIIGISAAAFVILIIAVVGSYKYAKSRTAGTVLPGGITYLGPSPSSAPIQIATGKISIPAGATWVPHQGKKFPYTFSYPNSLALGVFPNDPFDSVPIFWENSNPQENILLRIENLKDMKEGDKFIGKPLKGYAEWWWKQYNWKSVSTVTEFTNSKGMKGVRAKYVDGSGQTPYDNIFFEVPGNSNLVIWMASRLLEPEVFDKIVDSVNWEKITNTRIIQ